MVKWITIFGCILLIITLIGGLILRQKKDERIKEQKTITSFEECEKAEGSMIQESYPPTCVTADKRSFTQDIGNELEYTDLIQVDNPRPNQQISSPLKITGRARGTWFFEATFPIELLDESGKSLGTSVATAKREWMTEEFVPFTAELQFEKPSTKKGKLVIKNANPSGLPENEKVLSMPVEF